VALKEGASMDIYRVVTGQNEEGKTEAPDVDAGQLRVSVPVSLLCGERT